MRSHRSKHGDSARKLQHRAPSLGRKLGCRLLDQLFPPTCLLCGAPGAGGLDLCTGCRRDLPALGPHCPRCGIPLGTAALCARCRAQPPPYDQCHAAFPYRTPISTLIGDLKFRAKLNRARLLGSCLAESLSSAGVRRPDALVPIPLHPKRLRQRGYNQTLEIARILSAAFQLPLDIRSCQRIRNTRPQVGLDEEARRRNVRGAFAVRGRPQRHLALLDDVVTTGSTAAELAQALLQAGAERVDLWAVARTVHSA